MTNDSVEIWGIYQDLHDAFEARSFTVSMALEIAGCSEQDLRVLLDEDLIYKDGNQFSLSHAEEFKALIEELRAGDQS